MYARGNRAESRAASAYRWLVTPEQSLVQGFGQRVSALESLRGLAGGVTTTHLRSVRLSDAAFDALVEGLADPNPRVRWWCIQVLDHVPDPRALAAVARLLDDPVPRVRRNAARRARVRRLQARLAGGACPTMSP